MNLPRPSPSLLSMFCLSNSSSSLRFSNCSRLTASSSVFISVNLFVYPLVVFFREEPARRRVEVPLLEVLGQPSGVELEPGVAAEFLAGLVVFMAVPVVLENMSGLV